MKFIITLLVGILIGSGSAIWTQHIKDSSKITIVDEMPRIRKLWEEQNKKVTDEKWEFMKITGELTEFFKQHSIIKL